MRYGPIKKIGTVSSVTDMSSVFSTTLSTDISDRDVSGVTNMYLYAFQGASAFNQDILHGNVSGVTCGIYVLKRLHSTRIFALGE
jgi:hypothetical protein